MRDKPLERERAERQLVSHIATQPSQTPDRKRVLFVVGGSSQFF